jgi:hypothetical protein
MITLHILEFLRINGFGTAINTDLLWERLPLGKNGIAIYSVGGERAHGRSTKSQLFELECRQDDDAVAADILDKIADMFATTYPQCDLPIIAGKSTRLYKHCRFLNIGNIVNLGEDANGKLIFKLTAQIIYKK